MFWLRLLQIRKNSREKRRKKSYDYPVKKQEVAEMKETKEETKEVIRVCNLSKSYHKEYALNQLSLSVKKASVFGLLGANGAGKSTAIACMLGTKKMDSGEVSILGMNPKKNRKQLFEHVGVQFQEVSYQHEIKVCELCEETSSLYKKPLNWKPLLEQFGILAKEKSAVRELSGGERQRLFIVLALIPNPKIVFLDELTTGLDAKARRDVWKHLEGLKQQGITIFLTSHFMDEVEKLCDEICILKKGTIVFYGTVTKAIETSPFETLEDAYLWYAGAEVSEHENVY